MALWQLSLKKVKGKPASNLDVEHLWKQLCFEKKPFPVVVHGDSGKSGEFEPRSHKPYKKNKIRKTELVGTLSLLDSKLPLPEYTLQTLVENKRLVEVDGLVILLGQT